ncbi:hypothetical protein [Clostridium sp. ZBS13]|uniref:hypothetical protein n=1 Tax=Clostridium sp. ZBS13 TaxID=2949971 RepID=UPI00207AB087|nr:hypothetical protein [Clostridium sp. ZBS13]
MAITAFVVFCDESNRKLIQGKVIDNSKVSSSKEEINCDIKDMISAIANSSIGNSASRLCDIINTTQNDIISSAVDKCWIPEGINEPTIEVFPSDDGLNVPSIETFPIYDDVDIPNIETFPMDESDEMDNIIFIDGISNFKVNNMNEFFETSFGNSIKGSVTKTNSKFQGQSIYEVSKKVDNQYLKKGDKIYLDNLHKDHLEVFDKRGSAKVVLNLDGTLNYEKTEKVLSEGRKLKIK